MIHPAAAPAVRGWLHSGEPLEFRVLSDSMAPTLRAGDIVRVVPAPIPDLRIADIVLVELVTIYRMHRLLSRRSRWRTHGDALLRLDSPIAPESILGRVVAVQRDGAWRDLPDFPWTLIPTMVALLRVASRVLLASLLRRIWPVHRP